MAARYTLGANERLKRQKDIEALFHHGKALSVFPLRVIWQLVPADASTVITKAGFSAPKKKFKRAVERNRVKRLLREAWRLQKHVINGHVPAGCQLHVFILFTDSALPHWENLFTAVGRVIGQLGKNLRAASHA